MSKSRLFIGAALVALSLVSGAQVQAYLSPINPDAVTAGVIPATIDNPAYVIGPGSVPDYLTTPNWAYTPPLRKFVDSLPGLGAGKQNNLGQYIPAAVPDITTYPGSDYYEIELREFTEKMHSDLPPTTLRGYIQVNRGTDTSACTDPSLNQPTPCTVANNTMPLESKPHYLGPIIVSKKDRPVRVKFINRLPTGAGGDLFVPVDTTIMGAGPFEIDYDPVTKFQIPKKSGSFTQNRAELHLHGGRTPWISDGTPHQWITPAGEVTDYPTGVSVENVPDMPDPGPGAQTYYWTNQQSSRMLFYHDHAWGITRLNVYVGEAAGYLIRDAAEQNLIDNNIIPGTKSNGTISMGGEIPLVIQDKTYVDATTVRTTDPTWNWGTGSLSGSVREPNTGDLWWPHVYMPAQNPFDITGIAPMGRWAYGPYFWPATNNPFQPVPNPYYNPNCDPAGDPATMAGLLNGFCQPPEIPGTPNPSWGAEAFMDTPIVNGTAYPVLTVEPKAYRFRILNAAHDRFFNLQLYKADTTVNPNTTPASSTACSGLCASTTEVKMLPALEYTADPTWPATWPADGRPGGIPDWNMRGPNWIMIGSEGGFLPKPVVIPSHPVNWNADVTTFNAGNVNTGSLILGPAERADVIVDFSSIPSGTELILYNDAPAPWPALDPHYDYYTGAPDNRDMGGADTTLPGFGPNTRTIMLIKVQGVPQGTFNLSALQNAFTPATGDGVFKQSQDPLIVGQGNMNPTGDPALYEAFIFDQDYSAINSVYNYLFPTTFPNWGVARINDKTISFRTINPDGTVNPTIQTVNMKFKAIQDEQGETFDDYGRMRAALGLELSDPGAGQVNFIVQTYSDPATEVINEDEVQVWKITHNGVDTHPVHFHLFDVQVLNRVGWDGFIRLPDPTELGWKDTVRISPLEDTIVALKPVKPKMPFGVPNSFRPLNPATPIGDTTELSMVDPNTGQAWAQPNVNRMLNFNWEYVWHCHILSHEENDMMRPIQFIPVTNAPDQPVLNAVTPGGLLSWTDPTPANIGLTLGNPKNEIGFRIHRCNGTCTSADAFTSIGTSLANATAYSDTTVAPTSTYSYRVVAFNAAGSSPPSNIITVTTSTLVPPSVSITAPAGGSTYAFGTAVPVTASATADTGLSITKVEFFVDGLLQATDTAAPYGFNWTAPALGSYTVTAKAYDSNGLTSTAAGVLVTIDGYVISVTQGANGTITPAGTGGVVAVPAGGSQLFTISPNPGYFISNVTVDAAPLGPVASYQFTNVNANHSISATFAASPSVRIGTVSYPTLQAAYDAATTGSVIRIPAGVVPGPLVANRNIIVTLAGGYNAAFTAVTGTSSIQGTVSVRRGKVNALRTKIK